MLTVLLALAHAGTTTEVKLDGSGRQETLFSASSFGRYAFEVQSPSGTSLQLIDRMTGPGPVSGRPGEANGRLNAFLDVGEVKVVATSDPLATGTAALTITPYETVGSLGALPNEGTVTSTLQDKQVRTYFVEHTATRQYTVETIGRFVDDVRLWRDGTWLVAAEPTCRTVEPSEGQPMRRCLLSTNLQPGKYVLAVYGGEAEPWAAGGNEAPLYVQEGVETLAEAGVRHGRIPATGVERFRIRPSVDLAHLRLPDNAEITLGVGALKPHVFGSPQQRSEIDDESRLPVAELRLSKSKDYRVVSIEGEPGQPYTLTWFPMMSGGTHPVSGNGPTWVSTVSTMNPDDVHGPTGVFYRAVKTGDILSRTAGLELSSGSGWRERFNLNETTELIVEIADANSYRFAFTEGEANLRVEPFFTSKVPKDYRSPKMRRDEWTESLEPGLYRVTLEPRTQGIVTLEARSDSWTDWAKGKVGLGSGEVVLKPEIQEVLQLDRGADLTLAYRHDPASRMGLIERAMPIDVSNPLPISLLPGEEVTVPIRGNDGDYLVARLPNGEPMNLVSMAGEGPRLVLLDGEDEVTLRHTGDAPTLVVLGVEPPDATTTPVPSSRVSLPDFPVLTDEEPAFFDLARGEESTFLVDVLNPGFFRVQSSGLLKTSGILRSRVTTMLGGGSANGVGRNFLVDRYLRTGRYQLTVSAMGGSAGHLGAELAKAETLDGGELQLDAFARATVPAGAAVRYRFDVEEPGEFTFESRGLSATFRCRLEDSEGWPLSAPDAPCSRTQRLEKGSYSLVLLPEQVETRRLTRVIPRKSPVTREGHGPFPVELGVTGSHVWTEPTDGGERTPDEWTFVLPASSSVSIAAGDEMAGELLLDGQSLGRIVPSKTLTLELEPGSYTVKLRGARKGNGVPYALSVRTKDLTVGQSRYLSAPAKATVRVGESGLVTLRSEGGADVRARLLDEEGAVVAANDDRPDDWNFRLSTWLEPGVYTLELGRMGSSGNTVVTVEAPPSDVQEPMKWNKETTVSVSGTTAVLPIEPAGKQEVFIVRAEGEGAVGVAAEMKTATGWRSLGNSAGADAVLVARRVSGAPVRVRVWSLDDRQEEVSLSVATANVRKVGREQLQSGLSADGAASYAGDRPGLFEVDGRATLCAVAGEPCEVAPRVVALDRSVVLYGEALKAKRLDQVAGAPIELTTAATTMKLGGEGVRAVVVRSGVGQPGVRAGGPTALAERAAAALDLGGTDAEMWKATPGPAGMPARVWVHELAKRPGANLSLGRTEVSVPARTVMVLGSAGERSVEAALDRDTMISLGEQSAWADGEAHTAVVEGTGAVTLANFGDEDALVVLLAADGAPSVLGANAPLEIVPSGKGGIVMQVEQASMGVLRTLGASVRYLRADGVFLEGDDIEVGPGGTAWFDYAGREPVMSWVELPGEAGPWFELPRIKTAIADGPGAVELRGYATELTLKQRAGEVTHVDIDAPYMARMGWSVATVERRPHGGRVDLWLPDGNGVVTLRGFGETPLRGDARVSTSKVTAIGEGLGPEVMLEAGGTRWFRFETKENASIGFGVRATADRVTARVVDDRGQTLAEGVVGQLVLPKGSYLLALSQPPSAAPVRARPALAGVDRPDRGPPEDVVKSYLREEGGAL